MHREGIRLAANDSSVLFYGLPLSSSNSIFIAWKYSPHVSLLVNYNLLPLALKPLLETECSKALLLTQGSVPAAPRAVRVMLCPWGAGHQVPLRSPGPMSDKGSHSSFCWERTLGLHCDQTLPACSAQAAGAWRGSILNWYELE